MAAEPRQPENAPNAKTGVQPGETPSAPKSGGPKRPVEEEDVFGGAERTKKNEDVESGNAKP
ncbi:MAG: hypothetical protein H7124_01075 [Phycisphaerales bacterium]|nr:hypothetical protein [Hyphomonadaceae bacterium]